jgi:ParB family chromosome partitioning protein
MDKITMIDIDKIVPPFFQIRKHLNEETIKTLGASCQREGLLAPIMVRPIGKVEYEIIVGYIRWLAYRDHTTFTRIPSVIKEADDREALRIFAAENFLRDDLSVLESIETNVVMVDMELIDDEEYAAMGEQPVERVRTLLGKLDTAKRNQERGFNVNPEIERTSHKFVRRIQKIFQN